MYALVEQTKKHNAIYCNNFEDIIVRVTNTAMMPIASTMSISSHELINACWKQLNIKNLGQQVDPDISSFALRRSATTQILRIIGVYNAIPHVPFISINT